MFYDIVHGALRGQVGQLQAQAWNRKDLPSVAAGEITRLPRDYGLPPPSPGGQLALDSETVHQASTVNGRNLQESDCADGTSPISVSSTAFPLLEGCLDAIVLDDGTVAYQGETSVVISQDGSTSTDVRL